MLKIKNATYIKGAADKSGFIKSDKPIIAVCGKSNVGKSSFINMLANNKKLARVSKEPGRTRLVNYFDFGDFILADLPGYGFARVSKAEKERWGKTMGDFFADKSNAAHVFALCDIRHEPTAEDLQMAEFLYYNIIPFTVVATKADKLSKMQCGIRRRAIASAYTCGEDNVIAVSSQTKTGLEAVLGVIETILKIQREEDV